MMTMAKKLTVETDNGPKRLYRSRKDKMISGVCGGIAEYFDVDPVWVRLLTVLIGFTTGVGIIVYLIAWIVIPKNPDQVEGKATQAEVVVDRVAKRVERRREGHGAFLAGMILIVVGAALLLRNFVHWIHLSLVWPILIILVGLFFLLRRRDHE
jgi:phage shock protein C